MENSKQETTVKLEKENTGQSTSQNFVGKDGSIVIMEGENDQNFDISLRFVLFWAIILGLGMNWLAMYLKISMGFVSVGIGPMAVLLIGRQILKRRNAASRQNLTTILIAYGATSAAESSVGLLFLIWLATNYSFFGIQFVPPWWLLPSAETIANRSLFTAEWIVPLLVHYGIMLVPGILGLVFGWYMKDSFIHDDEAYPFPGMISQNSQVAVLTDESESRGPLFWKISRYGFLISLITILVPGLFIIDFSNISQGFIFGLMLGPVGIALLAAGVIIGNSKISIGPMFVSIFAYSILSIFLFTEKTSGDFYSYFNLLLQDYYFVPALALLLGGLILGPVVWSIVGSFFKKKGSKIDTNDENLVSNEVLNEVSKHESSTIDKSVESDVKPSKMNLIYSVLRKNWKVIATFTIAYFMMIYYVSTLSLIPAAPLWVISVLIFWNIIVGGLVNGYLVTMGVAKSNSAFSPPFVFDVIPIFIAGGAGFTPYIAMPNAETDGSAGIVSSQKLAQMNGLTSKNALIAYISGYLATSLTTPIFALFMWRAFGIGTASFPAPAFPVQGAILASFASRDVSSFIDLRLFLIFLLIAILLSRGGSDFIFGLVIGLLFPPHMAILMATGGIIRVLINRRYSEEEAKDISATIGPGLAVGASFVIPIMIVLALF